jgi:hypothetical protein
MYARVLKIQAPVGTIDEARRAIEGEAIPALRALPGFAHGYWLADRQSGRALTVLLWEDEQALRDSEEVGRRIREGITQRLGATIEAVEAYEVIASA